MQNRNDLFPERKSQRASPGRVKGPFLSSGSTEPYWWRIVPVYNFICEFPPDVHDGRPCICLLFLCVLSVSIRYWS